MAGDYSSGKTTISGNVTTTISTLGIAMPVATQTLVNVRLVSNGANQNIYTVTAGKKFYLMGFSCTGVATNGCAIFRNDGTTYVAYAVIATNQTYINVSSYCPIWCYQATENVVVNMTTGQNIIIWGIEQ